MGGGTTNTAGNKRTYGTVHWTKISADSSHSDPLAGSEWKLEYKDEQSSEWQTLHETIVDCTAESNNTGCIDKDHDAGQFTINNLKWGTYRLTETKAPKGYSRSDKEYTFTIDKDHLTEIQIYIGLTQNDNNKVTDNKIPNEPGVTLPSAGESGILHVVAIGIGVTVLGLIGFEIITRKRAA